MARLTLDLEDAVKKAMRVHATLEDKSIAEYITDVLMADPKFEETVATIAGNTDEEDN